MQIYKFLVKVYKCKLLKHPNLEKTTNKNVVYYLVLQCFKT